MTPCPGGGRGGSPRANASKVARDDSRTSSRQSGRSRPSEGEDAPEASARSAEFVDCPFPFGQCSAVAPDVPRQGVRLCADCTRRALPHYDSAEGRRLRGECIECGTDCHPGPVCILCQDAQADGRPD